MSNQMLEVSLLGVGTVLRLERDAWSMVKWLRQATQMSTPASMFEISIPYATVYYTTPPPWGDFPCPIARQPRGCQHRTIHVCLREALDDKCFQRRPFAHRHYFSDWCGDTVIGKSAQGVCMCV